MTTKALGTSISQKPLNLQKKAGVPYANLVTVFLIERLVARLIADESLRKSLVFKGGFVSMKAYDFSRYTVDLDALLLKSNIEKTLDQTKKVAEHNLNGGVWFHFESQIDLETQGEYGGIRQIYRAGIGEKLKSIKKAQIVNFDLGFGDPITPGPVKVTMPTLLSQEELSWSVYPIETMIAEKIHALVFLGAANSRSKDVYNLTVFLPKADAKILKMAFRNSFAYRKTELPQNISIALKQLDTTTLERGWKRAIAHVADSPQFKVALSKSCLIFARSGILSMKTKGPEMSKKKNQDKTLIKPSPSEMCPPGSHVVRGHERTCESGTVTWVDAHIRKNRGKIRPGLLKENIHFLFWSSKQKYPGLNEIKEFEGLGSEYDRLIQFWLDYWKEQGIEFPKDLDPLMVKAMIAVESTFDPSKITKAKNSTAAGLMQVTDQSLRVMGGFPNKKKWIEMRKHLIHVEKVDKLDPVTNVALGVRMLGHKWSQIKNPKKRNIRQLIRDYHSRDKGGDVYADKVLSFYEKSRKKK